jgi:hypothetical protein
VPDHTPVIRAGYKEWLPGQERDSPGISQGCLYMVCESRHIHIGRQICLPIGDGLRRGAICREYESSQKEQKDLQ